MSVSFRASDVNHARVAHPAEEVEAGTTRGTLAFRPRRFEDTVVVLVLVPVVVPVRGVEDEKDDHDAPVPLRPCGPLRSLSSASTWVTRRSLCLLCPPLVFRWANMSFASVAHAAFTAPRTRVFSEVALGARQNTSRPPSPPDRERRSSSVTSPFSNGMGVEEAECDWDFNCGAARPSNCAVVLIILWLALRWGSSALRSEVLLVGRGEEESTTGDMPPPPSTALLSAGGKEGERSGTGIGER